MASEPVTVWVSTDADGDTCAWTKEPSYENGIWDNPRDDRCLLAEFYNGSSLFGVDPGGCVPFVLIPADQYRQPTADLLPVAAMVATVAATLGNSPRENLPQMECINRAVQIAKASIAAARKIESEVLK